jgi:hypothetical protein
LLQGLGEGKPVILRSATGWAVLAHRGRCEGYTQPSIVERVGSPR